MRQAFRCFWGSAGVAALVSLAGCAGEQRAPVRLLVGWDTSGSARNRLQQFAGIGGALVRRCRVPGDRVTLYRLDYDTVEFYDGPPPASLEALNPLLVRELTAAARRPATRPATFWLAAAERAAASSDPTVVALLTDGGNDDLSAAGAAELRDAVRRLAAADTVLRVCVWGVLPRHRAALRRDLAQLGDRLDLRGLDGIDPSAALADLSRADR